MGIRCPSCHRTVLQRSDDGAIKVRTRMLVLRKSGFEVLCRHCSSPVPLDVLPGPSVSDVLSQAPAGRLVIRTILDKDHTAS